MSKFSSTERFEDSWSSFLKTTNKSEGFHFSLEPPFDSNAGRPSGMHRSGASRADRILSFTQFQKKHELDSHLGPGTYNAHRVRFNKMNQRRRQQGEGFLSTTPRAGLFAECSTPRKIGPGSYIKMNLGENDYITRKRAQRSAAAGFLLSVDASSPSSPSRKSARGFGGTGRDLPCAMDRVHRSIKENVPAVGKYDAKDTNAEAPAATWMFRSTTPRSNVRNSSTNKSHQDEGQQLAPNSYSPNFSLLFDKKSHRVSALPDPNFTPGKVADPIFTQIIAVPHAGRYQPDYDQEVQRERERYSQELNKVAEKEAEPADGSDEDSDAYLDRILEGSVRQKLTAKEKELEAENMAKNQDVDAKYQALRALLGDFQMFKPRLQSHSVHQRSSSMGRPLVVSTKPMPAFQRPNTVSSFSSMRPPRASQQRPVRPSTQRLATRPRKKNQNGKPPLPAWRPRTTRLNSSMFRSQTPREVFRSQNSNPPAGSYEVQEAFNNTQRREKTIGFGIPFRGTRGGRVIA